MAVGDPGVDPDHDRIGAPVEQVEELRPPRRVLGQQQPGRHAGVGHRGETPFDVGDRRHGVEGVGLVHTEDTGGHGGHGRVGPVGPARQ